MFVIRVIPQIKSSNKRDVRSTLLSNLKEIYNNESNSKNNGSNWRYYQKCISITLPCARRNQNVVACPKDPYISYCSAILYMKWWWVCWNVPSIVIESLGTNLIHDKKHCFWSKCKINILEMKNHARKVLNPSGFSHYGKAQGLMAIRLQVSWVAKYFFSACPNTIQAGCMILENGVSVFIM